jgi:hypothetical protein
MSVGPFSGKAPSRGYHVNNCVWTQHERFNNRKRTTFWVPWMGRWQSLADLARLENVHYEKLRGRLRRTRVKSRPTAPQKLHYRAGNGTLEIQESVETLRGVVRQLKAEGSTYIPYIDNRSERRRPKSWRHEILGDERRSMPVGVPV